MSAWPPRHGADFKIHIHILLSVSLSLSIFPLRRNPFAILTFFSSSLRAVRLTSSLPSSSLRSFLFSLGSHPVSFYIRLNTTSQLPPSFSHFLARLLLPLCPALVSVVTQCMLGL